MSGRTGIKIDKLEDGSKVVGAIGTGDEIITTQIHPKGQRICNFDVIYDNWEDYNNRAEVIE